MGTTANYACNDSACGWKSTDVSRPLSRGTKVGCPICKGAARFVGVAPQPAPDAEGEWRVDEVLKSLFTNGAGEEADRLLLIKEPHSGAAKVSNAEYLGGYSKAAVRSILKNAFPDAALASTQEKQ